AASEPRCSGCQTAPAALQKTCALVVCAGVVPQFAAIDLPEPVAVAARIRGRGPRDVDIQDPFRLEPAIHRSVADQISAATVTIAGQLNTIVHNNPEADLRTHRS